MMAEATAPNQRQFSLNSPEAYEALCARQDRPWIMNGSLPREPRLPELPVLRDDGLPPSGERRPRLAR